MIKHYIYRTRCLQERISVKSCENYLLHYVNIEEYIAKSVGKLELHKNKWSELRE